MDPRSEWDRIKRQHMPEILGSPVMHYLVTGADQVIAYQHAEISRLQSELDAYTGRTVLHCTESGMDAAALASLDEADGTILRATDTGRELVLADHTWVSRQHS